MKLCSGLKRLDSGRLHAVVYINDQGIYNGGKYRLKSGIASNDTPKSYTSQTVRTEGRGKRWILWDDNFIHQDLSDHDAVQIIKRMDKVFKQHMIDEGFNVRKNSANNSAIGTEYYEHENKNELIEFITDVWHEAYRIAYESVMKVELGESLWIEEFKPRPGQDTYIINASLKENIIIGYGVHQEPQHSVVDAIEKASLTSFVASLPNGVDTILGERGSRLSGGQKQRVGLARALYTEPDILIMDEATSALDAETEFEVMSALEDLGRHTTVIMIAHRLSSIRKFPRIVYLENGFVIGDGEINKLRREIPRFDNQLLLSGI